MTVQFTYSVHTQRLGQHTNIGPTTHFPKPHKFIERKQLISAQCVQLQYKKAIWSADYRTATRSKQEFSLMRPRRLYRDCRDIVLVCVCFMERFLKLFRQYFLCSFVIYYFHYLFIFLVLFYKLFICVFYLFMSIHIFENLSTH